MCATHSSSLINVDLLCIVHLARHSQHTVLAQLDGQVSLGQARHVSLQQEKAVSADNIQGEGGAAAAAA
jgi:hypothetical protein